MAIRIQTQSFDPGTETNIFLEVATGAGAAVSFTGLVRSDPHDPIASLTLDCYPELATSQLNDLSAQAIARFGLMRTTIIHRYGTLKPGEPIVQVMTLAMHRKAAFDGAEFLMDFLKTDAPFWKKETGPNGEHWVEAKPADDKAKARWS